MDLLKYPIPHSQTAARIVDGTAIIVLADSGQVNVLNAVGTRIWELTDGKRNLQEIADVIQSEYKVSPQQALQDLTEFMQEMLVNKIISLEDTPGTRTL
jgi:hypothetical protein